MHGRLLGILAIVAVVLALLTSNTVLARLAYVLVGVLIAAWLLTFISMRGIVVSRRTRATRSEVGGLAEETLSVTNQSWLPKLWLEVRDFSELPGHRASRVVSALGPGHTRTWTVRTVCRKRGVFHLGPLVVTGGDPLGMFQTERELPETASFVVYPMTVPLRVVDLPTGYLSGGQVVRRRAEFATTNVRGVRAYQPGDAISRIHWPTTARRGRLYTKEFELDPIADFWLLVDLDREVHPAPEGIDTSEHESDVVTMLEEGPIQLDPTTEEYAIAAAASLARHFLGVGKSVGLIAYGQRRVVVPPDRGDRQAAKLLGHLAVLRAVGRAGLSQVLSTENHEFTRHTTLVVVTPSTNLRWLESLRELRHRGVASLVVLLEASSFGTAAPSDAAVAAVAADNIPYRVLRCGEDLATALEGVSRL